MSSKKFAVIIYLVLTPAIINAQSFGFGCLGFVGGYGGYSYQQYNPNGLNDYIQSFNSIRTDSLNSPMAKFGKAQGYRFGINFFRANFKGFILTTKGFYQKLSEENKSSINSFDGTTSEIYELELTNWGLGIDLGTTITKGLSWKVIDAALLYNTATFTDTRNAPGPSTVIKKFDSENPTFGYTVGTGFILALVEQYISLEGVAGYTVLTINKMKAADGTELTSSENSHSVMNNFISGGGFNAVVQLNIGFPL